MKNIYTILILLLFLTGIGGLVFFVKKQLDQNKEKAQTNSTQPTDPPKQQPTTRQIEQSQITLDIKSAIDIGRVNTISKSFSYDMHYNGIGHSGTFQEGDGEQVLKKSFGYFAIRPRVNEELIKTIAANKAPTTNTNSITTKGGTTKASTQKIRGGVTRKTGARPLNVAQIDPLPTLSPTIEWVDLIIFDTKEKVLNGLSVNLSSGEQKQQDFSFYKNLY